MAKAKTQFTCSDCGNISGKWMGQCSACQQWNTLVETAIEAPGVNRLSQQQHRSLAQTAPVLSLADIEAIDVPRFGTGIEEFDRVLGGGLVAGGVVLIGGDPGIGKSTLLLQALANMAQVKSTLYVSGEESGAQIALRARRLNVEARELKLQAEIQLEKILGTLADLKPDVAVIDSIQTIYSDALTSAPGSVAQVRECAAQLTRVAKQTGITIILVGHVTKEGALAGPRVL
ncbi:MAG: DNA repair protein RadA, partial [Massilia sp.]|nr:DNA repair protein RadA [Massilia sp.]